MRIVYVVPGAMSRSSHGVAEMKRREQLLQSWAFPGTNVSVIDVDNGVHSIESAYEELLSAPQTVETIQALERNGCDAAIIGCFGDPGLDAARELVTMPVIGPGESSLLLAAHLGHRVGVMSVFDSLAASHRHQAFRAGMLDKLGSVRGISIPVLDLMRDPEATFERLLAVGRRMIEDDGAETLIFGCMTMSFLGFGPRLSATLGVPVINAAQAALKAAESQVSIGLSHSKKSFPPPPKLQQPAQAARVN